MLSPDPACGPRGSPPMDCQPTRFPGCPGAERWGTITVSGVTPLADRRAYCYAAAAAAPGTRHRDELAELATLFGDWRDPIPELLRTASHRQIAAMTLRNWAARPHALRRARRQARRRARPPTRRAHPRSRPHHKRARRIVRFQPTPRRRATALGSGLGRVDQATARFATQSSAGPEPSRRRSPAGLACSAPAWSGPRPGRAGGRVGEMVHRAGPDRTVSPGPAVTRRPPIPELHLPASTVNRSSCSGVCSCSAPGRRVPARVPTPGRCRQSARPRTNRESAHR